MTDEHGSEYEGVYIPNWAIEFAKENIFNTPMDTKDLDLMADCGLDASSCVEVYNALNYLHGKDNA